MGQKVNPVAFRVGVMEGWKSRWYAPKKEFSVLLVEDKKIRDFIKKHTDKGPDGKDTLSFPGVAKIEIERIQLKGEIPNPANPPSGCYFHTRCPYATDLCRKEQPQMKDYGNGHQSACHRCRELYADRL